MITEQENFLKFANGFADLSGEILTKNFLKHRLTHSKSDGSFVTEIDNLIEEKFIKQVKKNIS